MSKIAQIFAGERTVWSDWQFPIRGKGKRNYKLCCCDCGLVHNVQFRLMEGRIAWRMSINKRSTALVRRQEQRRK